MLCDCRDNVQGEEEQVLSDDWRVGKKPRSSKPIMRRTLRQGRGIGLLNPSPSDVDIEEHEQRSQPEDTGVKPVVCPPKTVKQEMPINLGLDEDKINEQNHKVVLNVLVGETLAVGALRESNALT